MARDYKVSFFCNLQHKSWWHFHKIFNKTFIFKNINNGFCCVETMKQFLFIKGIFRPKFNMLTCSPSSFIHIFHFFVIDIKKSRFQNWLFIRRFIANPFNNLKFKNFKAKMNKNIRCRSNNITVRLTYNVKPKRSNFIAMMNKNIRWKNNNIQTTPT